MTAGEEIPDSQQSGTPKRGLPRLPPDPGKQPTDDGGCVAIGHPMQTPRVHTQLCLAGDALQLMMAPGDVFVVRGNGQLSNIGNAGGFLGHVLLVVGPPKNVWRDSREAHELQAVWPTTGNVLEMWRVCTMECSRSEPGLHEVESLLYVERKTGQLVMAGEMTSTGKLTPSEHEYVELWQSPRKLRESLRLDLMQEVLADMRVHKADWSSLTVARAVLRSARVFAKSTHQQTMEKITDYWKKEPICTSVVIIFWQRYLDKLAGVVVSKVPNQRVEPAELIMRWMPLKADRVLPGDLLSTLTETGWVAMIQIPRIFQPFPRLVPPPDAKAFPVQGEAKTPEETHNPTEAAME